MNRLKIQIEAEQLEKLIHYMDDIRKYLLLFQNSNMSKVHRNIFAFNLSDFILRIKRILVSEKTVHKISINPLEASLILFVADFHNISMISCTYQSKFMYLTTVLDQLL